MSRSTVRVWGKPLLGALLQKDGKIEITIPSSHQARYIAESGEEVVSRFGAPDDPDLRRLFQTTHENDAALESAYRAKTRDALRARKIADGRSASTILTEGKSRFFAYRVRVEREQAEEFLRFLNDLRLVYGTLLDIKAGDRPLEPVGEKAGIKNNYIVLSKLQRSLLAALQPKAS